MYACSKWRTSKLLKCFYNTFIYVHNCRINCFSLGYEDGTQLYLSSDVKSFKEPQEKVHYVLYTL